MSTAQEVHSTRMTGVLTVVPFRGCNYFVALLPLRVLKPNQTAVRAVMMKWWVLLLLFVSIYILTVSFVQVLCKKSLSDYNNLNCQTSEKNIKLIVNLRELWFHLNQSRPFSERDWLIISENSEKLKILIIAKI